MTVVKELLRQGDISLTKIASLPSGCEEIPHDNGRTILAYGEVTGHAHAVPMAYAKQYRAGSGVEYVVVEKATKLTHEEHAPISLEPGVYQKRVAREYSLLGERKVID